MLPELRRLLKSSGFATRLECLLVLSNIAAGSIIQVQTLIDEAFVPEFLRIINSADETIRLRREACWGLSNMTSHRIPSQIEDIASEETLKILVQFICTTNEHPSTSWKVIQSIVNIVESADDPDSRYEFTGASVKSNKYVDYLKGNQNVVQALMRYLESLEECLDSAEYQNSEQQEGESNIGACRQNTIELLKQLFSKRFRDYWSHYCHHKVRISSTLFIQQEKINELLIGFEATMTLESGCSVQTDIDPRVHELLGKFEASASITAENI